MRHTRFVEIGFVLLAAAPLSLAQDAEPTKELSRRGAEADAHRKLRAVVLSLPINADTRVRDWVGQFPALGDELESFIGSAKRGDAMWDADGTCRLAVELSVVDVAQWLRSAAKRVAGSAILDPADLASMPQRIGRSLIRLAGRGAVRPDLPCGVSDGVLTPLGSAAASAPPFIPELWRSVGPQARLLALEAARVDGMRRLVHRVQQIRLTPLLRVRELAASGDVLRAELRGLLAGVSEGSRFLHKRVLIAEVELTARREQVGRAITKLFEKHYAGPRIDETKLAEIVSGVARDIKAVGIGVPPPPYVRRGARLSGSRLPDWSLQRIEADGQAAAGPAGSPRGGSRAAHAAELAARKNLAETLANLTIKEGTTIRDLVASRERLAWLIDAVVANSPAVSTRTAGDAVQVTVAVHGMWVWSIVSDELRFESPD